MRAIAIGQGPCPGSTPRYGQVRDRDPAQLRRLLQIVAGRCDLRASGATDVHLFILGGACVGGLISVITGFGTGMVALPIWLQATTPLLASPLVVICSLVAQLQTLPAIWHALD